MEEFCAEVTPTKVLSGDEVTEVCIYFGSKKRKRPKLDEICEEVQVRQLLRTKSSEISINPILGKLHDVECDYTCVLETKNLGVELCLLTLGTFQEEEISGFSCDFTVNIEQVDRPETRVSVTYNTYHLSGNTAIPISTKDREVLLLPNSRYTVNISCDYHMFDSYESSSFLDNEHFSINYSVSRDSTGPITCIKRIDYRTVNL